MKTLIVTADDFGLAREVNEAVQTAHTNGILGAASLMVGAPAAADAVARARTLPSLRVGLHLVLVEGRPVLPARTIPDLVDARGLLRNDLPRLGADIFFGRSVRRQVAAEIEAQFGAFAATGLLLDHVDGHRHFHLHPTVARLLFDIGRNFHLRAVRVPLEPAAVLARIAPNERRWLTGLATPWAALLAVRARRRGLRTPDRVFGLAWSGAMNEERVRALVEHLPDGVSEMYLHPATAGGFEGAAAGYRYADELAALTAPAVRAAVRAGGVRLGSYGDLTAA